MKRLIIAFLFLSFSTVVFAAKVPATKQTTPEAPAKKFNVSVNATLNNQPKNVAIKIYQRSAKGMMLVAEADTSKGQPVKFKLTGNSNYRIEAFFSDVNDTAVGILKNLSKDATVNLNLEYYNVSVSSLYNNAADPSAAAAIRIAARSNQARTIASGHTDSYTPATFFLPARKSYVVGIKYDDANITANPNGKVIYDLKSNSSVVFNY